MNPRFHIGSGRRFNLHHESRFKKYTYGQDKLISDAGGEIEVEEIDTHGTYGSLLFDKRWLERRAEILTRDEHKCVICKNVEKLQVHHRQYHMIKATQKFKPPWDYPDVLLVTLCESCHKRGHSKYKVPTILI